VSIVFHIGLHKTGTTFLQRAVFPKLDGIHVVDQDIRKLFNSPRENRLLVTHEGLSGDPFEGAWWKEFKMYVRGISRLFPGSECILGFRRHDEMILSLYKQYLHEGGTRDVTELFALDGTGRIHPDELFFENRLEFAREHFSDVLVYTQNELRQDLTYFLKRVTEFLEIDLPTSNIEVESHNVGIKTSFQARLLRFLNRMDDACRRLPFIPSLNNTVFRRLRLTPRDICQRRLRNMGGKSLQLPDRVSTFLRTQYEEDWSHILEVRRRQNESMAKSNA